MLESGGLLLGIAVGLAGAWWARSHSRSRRRRKLRQQPLPPAWEAILRENLPLYRRLPESLRQELHGHVQIFLDEKDFEGCGGLTITDEIRVTIAGQACMLLLNRPTRHYHGLSAVLVYPKAYISNPETHEVRLGESWSNGTVVLSWSDVNRTAHDPKDGLNLVLHEFAHQLDQEDGVGDGVPLLEQESRYALWGQLMDKEYQRLVQLTRKGRKDVLQSYGATNPAEFFAVATEAFFEKPRQLHEKHPELYEELKTFYHLDPLAWKEA